jgi:hypothetical protein
LPKAGAFGYPSRDLDDCVSYLRRARESLKSRTMTREGFAQAIGQSATGGGFGKLVGALTEYGLVETGRNQIATTDLGEQVLYGTLDEQRAGREKSVRGVRLFSEIYRKLGREPTDDQLRLFLREKAGVDILTAKSTAEEIGKLLRNNAVHLPAGPAPQVEADANPKRSSSGELVGRLEMTDYGILNIRDEISMDLAISLLAQVKKVNGWGSLNGSGTPVDSGTNRRGLVGKGRSPGSDRQEPTEPGAKSEPPPATRPEKREPSP